MYYGLINSMNRVAAYSFPSGLINSYPANGSFNDTTGTNNFTAFNGVLSNSTPKLGSGGFYFDGVNDSVEIKPTPFNIQSFSYSFWANPDILNVGIFIIQTGADGYRLTIDSSGRLFFRRFVSGSTWFDITTSICVSSGSYQHIVVTRDNTIGTKIYCNNTLVGSETNLSATLYNTAFGFRMGADLSAGYITPFKGYIDSMQFFNKSLDTSEITGLYNSGIGREI